VFGASTTATYQCNWFWFLVYPVPEPGACGGWYKTCRCWVMAMVLQGTGAITKVPKP